MPASVFESVLARVASVLLSATTAGARVYRARDDAFGADEVPAINIRRADTEGDVLGSNGERHILQFTLACHTRGAAWETAADSLHMEAHALLMLDPTLNSLGRGLRCNGTDMQDDSLDQPAGRLTARYQIQMFVRPGALTVAI